jgi:hypothetical protein
MLNAVGSSAGQQTSGVVTRRFHGGITLGIQADWPSGVVHGVVHGSPSEASGVIRGWRLKTINGADYSEALLDQSTGGTHDFTIGFQVGTINGNQWTACPQNICQGATVAPPTEQVTTGAPPTEPGTTGAPPTYTSAPVAPPTYTPAPVAPCYSKGPVPHWRSAHVYRRSSLIAAFSLSAADLSYPHDFAYSSQDDGARRCRGGEVYEPPWGYDKLALKLPSAFFSSTIQGWPYAYAITTQPVSLFVSQGPHFQLSQSYVTPHVGYAASQATCREVNGQCVKPILQCAVRPNSYTRAPDGNTWQVQNPSSDIKCFAALFSP